MRPLIGITADYEASGEFKSKVRDEGRYLLRRGYSKAVAANGADPIILPYDLPPENVAGRIGGLLITGGNFDIPPELSGIKDSSLARNSNPDRTLHEMTLVNIAMRDNIPILGICGGMQLLAVYFGGKMIGDILSEVKGALNHEMDGPREKPAHDVTIADRTTLHRITGTKILGVNSTHHQAVADPGSMVVSAVSTDGVIEAVELKDSAFVVGVEWHPEIMFEEFAPHRAIFEAFVRAAAARKSAK